ncbi:MAG: CdaR family protein [Verrucomicrobiota bacterium]|jgi:hypothetical protein
MALRDWVTKDLMWKLASLVVAAAIWHIVHVTIRGEPQVENPLAMTSSITFNNLPVLVVSAAADVREFTVNPNAVSVTISGAEPIVAALKQNEIHPMVNLTGIEAAQDLSKRVDVSTPPGVTLVNVEPADVNVVVPPK